METLDLFLILILSNTIVKAQIDKFVVCEPPYGNPGEGIVDCTDKNNLGSVCTLFCFPGFEPTGPTVSRCMADGDDDDYGRWSSPPAFCFHFEVVVNPLFSFIPVSQPPR